MDTELVLLLISAVLIIVGAYLWQKGNHLLANGKKADVVIFRNNLQVKRGDRNYYPVVRFLTDEQEWITQELNIGYGTPKPEGTKLEVLYDPENPTKVEINSPFQLEILPGLLVAPGVAGFIFGVLEYLNITQLSNLATTGS